jgi:hypothetical protein
LKIDYARTCTIPISSIVADSGETTGLKWAAPAAPTAAGASVYINGTNVAITSGVESLLTPTTSDYDTNSFWSSGVNPSRLTIPTGYAGKYVISTALRINGGAGYGRIFIYKNGSRFTTGLESGMYVHQSNLAANSTCLNGSVVLNLAATDYLQFYSQSDHTTGNFATWWRVSVSYQGA